MNDGDDTGNEQHKFGNKLKKLMLDKGWNQSELARRSGMGRDNVSGYIRGKVVPNAKHLHKLAQALKVEPNVLYRGVIHRDDEDDAAFEMKVLKNDPSKALIRINQVVSYDVAEQIVKLLALEARRP